jgi:protein transport protein SEC9
MKKFGFGKKDKDSGRSSNNSSPAPSSNPYAQAQAAADPYAQDNNKYAGMGNYGPSGPSPYQQAKVSTYGGLPNEPAPGTQRGGYGAPPPATEPGSRYGSSNGTTYGADRYGSGGGYGANRYDSGNGYNAPSRGPGGYGGLGRTNSNETTTTDDNRNALFGDAKDRYAQKSSLPPRNGQQGGGYEAESGNADSGYGGYGEQRELTAEEQEEEEIASTKQQIRFMKQEDVSSTRNALRIAAQAEETGRATLARLGAQGERIHNTEKNLDLATNHNRIAEEKAKELKTLNRSMFAVHVSNPFTASSRRTGRDEEILNKHRQEREERDATRAAAFGTQQRMEGAFRELQPGDAGYRPKQPNKASLAERAKYQFEADSEDEEMENEIDANLDALSGAAGRLNLLARATGAEVDEQNKHIDRIIQKSDRVDDQIAMSMSHSPLLMIIMLIDHRPRAFGPHSLICV